ncbi:MAG: tetratricopeptide repeat protein [Flavobacteriales bacterium]
MDRDRLTELLQDPSQVAKQDLAALRTMAERFPWFSGAHLLLAVGESETGDVLANDSRSLPAAFLPSRSVLFDLVHKEEPREPSTLRIVKDEEPLEESFPTSGIPVPKIAEPTDATRPLPASFRNERRSPDVTHVPFEQDANPLKDEGSVVKKTPEAEKLDTEREVLVRQIVEAVRASGYDLGQLAGLVPPSAPPVPKVSVPSLETIKSNIEPSPPADLPGPVPDVRSERLAPGPNTRLRFTDWLSQDAFVQPERTPSTASITATPTEPPTSSPAPPSSIPVALDQKEIMDHFIQHSTPARTTEKAVFFNPQQAAKRSLQDDGMVSETLARIHEKQGNFAKAREVYDRLALKHPEKSVYFAALSKALEARSNK